MSLSEKQPKMPNCSSNISYMNDDFVKLLWENGPIVSQSQSNKPRRSTFHSVFAPCGSKDNPFPKIGHFRVVEPKSNNHPLSGSSPGIGINARDDNDIVPWMNYPIDDSIHNGFCYPEFLNDYSEVNTNADTVPVADQVRSSHNVEHGLASEMGRITPQLNAAISSHKSSEINIGIGSSCKGQEKGVMNFSHFSRPVALARANLQDVDRWKSNKITSNNPMESSAVESASGLKSAFGTQHRPKELILDEQSKVKGDICKKNCNQNTMNPYSRSSEKIQSSSFEASVALGMHEIDKGNETAVAASSMCSCSSAGTTSNDHNQHWGKRKHCEGEESEYLSDDHEDESMDLKKHAPIQGKSKKRSRATEVHNLSERRRRDRINEKMRALQELIPNCNKMDKASMLDEAIEYLKYLQMQVQIMSMGSGLYMSPMMMQHVQASTIAHFSPMGVRMGMGIGLGYGMGMYDMNGSPFIQVPPVPGPQVRCLSGYQRMPGSHGLQIFGIPGQGFPVPTHYRSPSATTSEDPLQQKKTLEKSQGSDAENLRIQSTQAAVWRVAVNRQPSKFDFPT